MGRETERAHYERKIGMKLYPGTLNIRLANAYAVAGDLSGWRRTNRAVRSA